MVGEHGDELLFVLRLEQRLNRACGELGEGLVGGGEDRERPLALEGLDQPGGLHRSHERLEAAGADGRIDDVLAVGVERHGLHVGLCLSLGLGHGFGFLRGGHWALVGDGRGCHGQDESGREGETER